MQTITEKLTALREAGFLPQVFNLLQHPLLDAEGSPCDPRQHGFVVAHTGGGCEALEREIEGFRIMVTCEGGDTIPAVEEWAESLIGIYLTNDDRDEIGLFTGLEWQQLIKAVSEQP